MAPGHAFQDRDFWKKAARGFESKLIAAERELEEMRGKLEIANEAVIAMADDGWLLYGPEGMSESQQKCSIAYAAALATPPEK